jgi:hypothetical protein
MLRRFPYSPGTPIMEFLRVSLRVSRKNSMIGAKAR